MTTSCRSLLSSILTASLLFAAGAGLAQMQSPPAKAAPPAQQEARGGFNFEVLVRGLQSTPGCLGTEVAQFQSGKLAIFAWFENKAAARRWYDHPAHKGAMRGFFSDAELSGADHVPLAHIADDAGPLMVIATLTPNREGGPGKPPLAQISIEHYQPMPGGIAIAGRLAPGEVKVPHLREFADFGG